MSLTTPQRVTKPEPSEPEGAHLQAALQQRHLTMIALGGRDRRRALRRFGRGDQRHRVGVAMAAIVALTGA